MKIMTILGTRPEIIRLSVIIPLLDEHAERHILVHTGQNFTASLSGIFFAELGLRAPDYVLQDKQAGLGGQLAAMFGGLESILQKEQPDRVLLLGIRIARYARFWPNEWVFRWCIWRQATVAMT